MDPESKKLLESTYSLTEENNKLLHKIRGVQRRATLWQVAKIILIIAIAYGAFYYVEPYLNKVMNVYNSITKLEEKINNNPIGDFFKKF